MRPVRHLGTSWAHLWLPSLVGEGLGERAASRLFQHLRRRWYQAVVAGLL